MQGDVGCVDASTLPEQEEGAEVARQPSPVVASGGDIICESGVGKPSSGTAPGSGIGGGRTGIAGSLQDEQRQEGDDASNGLLCDGSKEALISTPGPKVGAAGTCYGETKVGLGRQARFVEDLRRKHAGRFSVPDLSFCGRHKGALRASSNIVCVALRSEVLSAC